MRPQLLRPIQGEADLRHARRMKWYVLAAAAVGALLGVAAALVGVEPPDWLWLASSLLLIGMGAGTWLSYLAARRVAVGSATRLAMGRAVLVAVGVVRLWISA